MRNFKNIVIIYPDDPTIDFLQSLFEKIIAIFPISNVFRPKHGDSLHTMIEDDTQLVLFLGHGTPSGLFGGANEIGEKQLLCDIPNAAGLLQDCSIVLFSCNSDDYLKKLQRNSAQIKNYIVFGDMPTDWEHIQHNKDNNSNYWTSCNKEQLDYYISTLIETVHFGFEKAFNTNSFYGFSKGVNITINKKINEIIGSSNWPKEHKLQLIERLIEFKNDIDYNEIII